MATGMRDHFKGITTGLSTRPIATNTPHARTAPSDLMNFSEEFQRIDRELKESKAREGQPLSVALDLLDDSPYQNRTITQDQIDELADHLQDNRQTTPITIRRKENGRFEIVAGHRRVAAFRKLGRTNIDAALVEMDDSTADMSVFFDNLLAPSLSDYEKYLGFTSVQQRLQDAQGGKPVTQEDLADKAGISRQLVGYILSFGALPSSVHAILKAKPNLFGAKLAATLARLSASNEKKVSEAVKHIEAGDMTPAAALDWIQGNSKSAPERTAPRVIKAGRSKFADIVRRQGQITVRLADASRAEEFEEAVANVLRDMVSKQKP